MKSIIQMIKSFQLPYAYHHFAEGNAPNPPFVVFYFPNYDHFAADGSVYFKQAILFIEIYTDKKDLTLEEKVEKVLDDYRHYYTKTETWIESERLFLVHYQMEVTINGK